MRGARQLLTIVIFVLYIYLSAALLFDVMCQTPGCTIPSYLEATDNVENFYAVIATFVGGLIAAILAVTPEGDDFSPMLIGVEDNDPKPWENWLGWAFFYTWIILGLAAFIVGTLQNPTVNSTLSESGIAFIGLALAAAYAYFGIQRR